MEGSPASEGLVLRDVRKTYAGLEVVRGVDLSVARGEFLVILGPSGCGKSTLLRMIAGLEDVSGGEIAIEGRRVTHLPPRKRACAMVFQNYALYPHLTVGGNIGYPLRIAGVPKAERARRVAEAARVVDLGAYLDRKPSHLSGGQRQRVAMARAIVREPQLFLFDEPLSNLDATLRVAMRVEIRRLHRAVGVTSVFVTHDQVEAMTLADRIVVMNAGHIEQVGRPTEIYGRPATRFVGGFVGAQPMSFLDARVGSDRRTVSIADGGEVPLAAPLSPTWAGRAITLGLRAEAVRIAPADAPHALRAHFEFSEELGPYALHHASVGGVDVLAQGPAGNPLTPGPVRLAVAPDGAHLFDPATGGRVEP